jgi:NAD-dependent deacetylase sirtuin 5
MHQSPMSELPGCTQAQCMMQVLYVISRIPSRSCIQRICRTSGEAASYGQHIEAFGSLIYTFHLCHPSHSTQQNASSPFDAMDQVDVGEASRLIHSAKNVLILLGAGLSQPSGIPTFQEPWEGIMPRDISSPSFFRADPLTSWRFFEDRRQKALQAVPNAGHLAIADFARRNAHAFTITQNIDGILMDSCRHSWYVCNADDSVELSTRALHPSSRLVCLHGSLFDVECTSEDCSYRTTNYSAEPSVPGLENKNHASSNENQPATSLEIPPCPSCGHGILRPGVVWFGEKLPPGSLDRIDAWFDSVSQIDIVMVIGTEALAQPAASYIYRAATEKGARVMHFNQRPLRPDQEDDMDEIDLYVQGNVAESLPALLGCD